MRSLDFSTCPSSPTGFKWAFDCRAAWWDPGSWQTLPLASLRTASVPGAGPHHRPWVRPPASFRQRLLNHSTRPSDTCEVKPYVLSGGSGFVPISGVVILLTPTQEPHTHTLWLESHTGSCRVSLPEPHVCLSCPQRLCEQRRTGTQRTHGSTETAGDSLAFSCCPGFSRGLCSLSLCGVQVASGRGKDAGKDSVNRPTTQPAKAWG